MTDRILQDWEKTMAAATPNSLLRDIVRDNRAATPPQRPPTVQVAMKDNRATRGWIQPRPLSQERGMWLSDAERQAQKEKELETLRQKLQQLDATSDQNDAPA